MQVFKLGKVAGLLTNCFDDRIPIIVSHIRLLKVSQNFNFAATQVLKICVRYTLFPTSTPFSIDFSLISYVY